MKARTLLLFLFLLSILNGSAALQESGKNIVLKKSTTSDGVLRSANLSVSAYLDISNEVLLLYFEDCLNDVSIFLTNLSTDEIIYSELHTISSNIVLNMGGLLEENSEYCLEIIIGETILYGDFDF
mgnify:FL=1